MKKQFGFLALVSVLIFLTSCGTTARVQKDDSVDFTKIRTYAWVDPSSKDSAKPLAKTNDLVDRKIKESIDKNLKASGWKMSQKNPDVLLVYEIDVEKEKRNQRSPVYSDPQYRYLYSPFSRRWIPVYYPSTLMGYQNSVLTVQEHTLTVTLLDAQSDKTIWQGWTTMETDSRRLTDKEIEKNVKAIVQQLEK
jgi:hypothetical protein